MNHQFRFQILTHWASSQNKVQPQVAVVDGATGGKVDLSAALNSIADTRNAEYAAAKAKTAAASKGGIAADKDVKAAIMAQYSQVRFEHFVFKRSFHHKHAYFSYKFFFNSPKKFIL
jgi:hypothetical protein